MPAYRVTRKADGAEVFRYTSDAATEWVGLEFEAHDHDEIVEPVDDPPPPPPPPVRITKLAFRNRFSAAEKVSVEIAALDDPAASTQARALAASLRAAQQDVQAADFIDLTRADTRDRVQGLEHFGVLAAGRAAEILDTPPAEHEVWNG